jgi:hypothetical protein
MDAGKDMKKKINVLEALHYTVAALQQVTQQTIENCFRKAGYAQGQSSGDSDVVLTNDDDDFRQDWEKFSSMNKDKLEGYVSVDSHVATSGVETVQELCARLLASGSVVGEGGEKKMANQSCAELCRDACSDDESKIFLLCVLHE